MFKDAKNRDGAWKFVQWLSKPEVQVKWYQAVKDLPAVQSAWDDASLSGDPYLKVFGEQLEDAKSPPTIPTWEQVAAVVRHRGGEAGQVRRGPGRGGEDHAGEGHRHRHRSLT